MKLVVYAVAAIIASAHTAFAQNLPITTCDRVGIGSVRLTADGPTPTISDVSSATAGTDAAAVPYCLVKVLVPQAINIWIGLPMNGKWNGKLQSIGGGGYAGNVVVPTAAILGGFVSVSTDTGHSSTAAGSFGMLSPGQPNTPLQIDFAYRSEHLMSVMGRQLTQAFYGQPPSYAYWNGCSTGGRQGLMMAQRYPEDYNGIVAGAPAIHWDRFQAAQIWPQVVMLRETGGAISPAKLTMATAAAVAACDAADGVTDKVIDDPRTCRFDARTLVCQSAGGGTETCLTESEAKAINKIWEGPVVDGKRLWWGPRPGADLSGLAGPEPFRISVDQPRYWVYYDSTWNWQTLNYSNYEEFFALTVKRVGPIMATADPDLSRFRERGGKLIMWHGWADQLIMPDGTIDYYDAVTKKLGGGYEQTRDFARLFMAPGVAHCGGRDGTAPQGLLEAVMDWVERGEAPSTLTGLRSLPDGTTRTRPLCPYPEVAVWNGVGSTDISSNFTCKAPR
ncbi:MAG TPA: tannase/feruloyl esterase family alpha/beta hydrolase [Vicinamibacterales bacterium]|jgi:pimeloyl-ACP methyl ester carboxylesterase|nr:tannase/feruloyl esterase family alpha/beta hydrolase [Vicinamibacterales bacterium]